MTAHAETATVSIRVNGEERLVRDGTSVLGLLRELALDPRLVVVEHNRVILRDRDAHGTVSLAAGDQVEIVHFVGGG